MRHRRARWGTGWWWAVGVLFGALLVGGGLAPGVAAQESKQLRWDRFDVTIDLHEQGSFRVCEYQAITFERGSFSTGFAVIPLGRVVAITEVQVREGSQPYVPGDGRQPGTFAVRREAGNLHIGWGFPPTSGTGRSFTLCYTVLGGLRVHEHGDQLWWKAIPADSP